MFLEGVVMHRSLLTSSLRRARSPCACSCRSCSRGQTRLAGGGLSPTGEQRGRTPSRGVPLVVASRRGIVQHPRMACRVGGAARSRRASAPHLCPHYHCVAPSYGRRTQHGVQVRCHMDGRSLVVSPSSPRQRPTRGGEARVRLHSESVALRVRELHCVQRVLHRVDSRSSPKRPAREDRVGVSRCTHTRGCRDDGPRDPLCWCPMGGNRWCVRLKGLRSCREGYMG